MAEISFIEDGKQLLNDIQDKIGKKGTIILLGGLGLAGVYLALKSFNTQKTSNDLVPATGYIGYPEAGENTDVIISELTDEITGSGASVATTINDSRLDIIEDIQESQANIFAELDELKSIMSGFNNNEQAKGEQANKENSNLTNGTVGGDFVNTDKGNIKEATTKEVMQEVPVTPNYVKGSDEEKFNNYRDEVSGKATYTQAKGESQAGQVYVEREKVVNEYGGRTTVNKLGDTVTIHKLDAKGHIKETETKNIKDL